MTELRELVKAMYAAWEVYGDVHITSYMEWIRDHAVETWEEWGCFSKGSSRPVETAHRSRAELLLRGTNGQVLKAKGVGKFAQAMAKTTYKQLPMFEGRQRLPYSQRSKAAPGTAHGVVHPRPAARAKGPAKNRYAPYPAPAPKIKRAAHKE